MSGSNSIRVNKTVHTMNETKTGDIFTRPPHQNTTQSTIFHRTKRISVGFSNGAYTADAIKNLNLVSTNPTQTLYMQLKSNLKKDRYFSKEVIQLNC